ncbi:glycosyltransferase family 4 protein [Magnetococcus sp. PR-3]|uniref:glycosyltransferase family 4 protein n=1 Tax=Magnetococcus sp. PR-3 TaxID=3120355 RepID=UPI002FCDE524
MAQTDTMIRLAIVSSHPIQYNAPFFKHLSALPEIDLHVFYSWHGTAGQKDPEFGETIQWDIPLLEGYAHHFVENHSKDPGTHHFNGLHNPDMVPDLKAWKPDVILIYGWPFRTHIGVMRYFKGRVPILFRGDSNLLSSGGFFNYKRRVVPWLRHWVLRGVYRYVDGVLPVGQHNDDYFRAFRLAEERRFFVPHMVDNQRFAKDHEARTAEALQRRRQFGIGDDDVVVLFAGKFVDHKQPLPLLKAVQAANAQCGGGLHLLFVGNGVLKEALQQQAQGDAAIHFMDTANQQFMPTVYRMGDVMALPSRSETWGLAVNEAMACQRPVLVSSRVGCAPDLVVHGETGFHYTYGEESQISTILAALSGQRQALLQMGEVGYQRIKQWSFEQGGVALLKALHGLLRLGPR